MPQSFSFSPVLLLTSREYEIFKMLGDGMTTAEISTANGRNTSVKTVRTHVHNMVTKTGLANPRQLICLAARYNGSGLKRLAILPPVPKYRFKRPEKS